MNARMYLRHVRSGEIVAAEVADCRTTHVCGPLHYSEVTADNLDSMHYEPVADDWIDAEWLRYEPTLPR